MMKQSIRFILIALCCLSFGRLVAQLSPEQPQRALYGNTGTILTPTGYLSPDGQLAFGVSYIPQGYTQINRREPLWRGDRVIYANLGLLPFLEVTFRLTSPDGSKNNFGIGDRSLFLRGRITKEKKILPAIAIGLHDVVGVVGYHHVAYLVGSKSVALNSSTQLILSAGYGAKIIKNVPNTYLQGFFGSASWHWKFVTLNAEYDAKKVNAALYVRVLKKIDFHLAYLDLKKWSGRVSMQLKLLK